jgi:hypothetical protein
MRIPLPVPKHVATVVSRTIHSPWWLNLYRIVLILVASVVVIGALRSSSVLLGAIASIILFVALVDDVSKAASDVWNANFLEVRT